MKAIIFFLVAAIMFGALAVATPAQSKLIILVRHAEKDISENADPNDPPLNAAGQERAQRFAQKIGKYRPGAFYSTDFKRTRDTVTPLATKRGKQVQLYDPRKPSELIERVLADKTKRVVIAGHSNTIPGLANAITKKTVFRNLDESEYTVIWLIRLKEGKVTKVELLDY
ncbi:MAG: histidine phosphatase family protein [Acidobacteria bacterium]|nr:histidine phosphatase family protein [Acidobacteriota bacterium]